MPNSHSVCPNCRHSYRSRHHAVHCGKKTLSQWHASRIGRSVRQTTPRRSAGEIFASQCSNRFPDIAPVHPIHDAPDNGVTQ